MRFPGYSGLITALVLMQGCGSSEPPPAPRPSVLPELRASGQALASAETARDLEAVMRLWTSDAVVHAEGTEALTGFMLITWSASFMYLEMEKFWRK